MRRVALLALLLAILVPGTAAAQTSGDTNDEEVLVRVNGSDTVEADESVGVVVIVSGNLEIAGEVTGTAVVVDGDLAVLSGATVEGTIFLVDGTLTMRDGATITGDVYLSESSSWVQEEGATFTGEVREGTFDADIGRDAAWQITILALVGWLGATLIVLIGAVVFAGIGGRQLWTTAANLTDRPGASILTTLVFWFGLALLVIPLSLSFIGILALPVVMIAGITVWFLGYIAFGTRIGASLTGQWADSATDNHPYLPAIAGTVVLQLVLLVAVGSLLIAFLAAALDDNGGLGLVFGIPALLLYVILWLVGLLGGGALVLRAINAWSNRV